MNLSDLPSYSSDFKKHSFADDDDKWISDDPLAVVNPPKSKDSHSDVDQNPIDDGREPIPKLLSESKSGSSSSRKHVKSARSNQSAPQDDVSETTPHLSDESISQSSSKKSKTPSQKSDKSAIPKAKYGYVPQIQIALSENKLAFADGTWQDVSDLGELIDRVHPIVAESIGLQKRAELLVRLISESEYESQLIQNEMNECDEIIKELRKVLGEADSESHSVTTEEEEPDDF